jgi:cytochrome P450
MIKTYRAKSLFQNYFAIRGNPIAFLSEVLGNCGDFARFSIFTFRFYVVNDPELVREALVEKPGILIIKGGVSGGLARLIGKGILTNHGEKWRESRRGLQPLFHQDLIAGYPRRMESLTQESLDRWKTKYEGRAFPINREILSLSFRITCSTLFSYLPTFEEAEECADAIWTLQSDGMSRYMKGRDFTPWIPSSVNRRVNRACRALRQLARKAIDHGADQPIDEILSILFAGTESPANSLCWALKLLEENEGWLKKLRAFVASERPAAEPENFDILSQVLSEVVRLYPAGWAFERFASEDTSLGGETIPKGSRLLFSPFLLHRNVRFWKNPEVFDPGRFSKETGAAENVPKYAYLPFGAGPRSCIGSRMAWMEMRIILGMILAQTDWQTSAAQGGAPLSALGSFKIRLNHPLSVKLRFGSN